VYEGLVQLAAETLRPWVWTAGYVAAGAFVLFITLRFWVIGCGLPLCKRARAARADAGGWWRGMVSALTQGVVGLATLISKLSVRVATAAAIVVVLGVGTAALASPAAAGAGEPMLALARQALQAAAPPAFANAADLSNPKVAAKGDATTYTFTAPKKVKGKAQPTQSYIVTVGPDGVKVSPAP
jgi:hypothetical protein